MLDKLTTFSPNLKAPPWMLVFAWSLMGKVVLPILLLSQTAENVYKESNLHELLAQLQPHIILPKALFIYRLKRHGKQLQSTHWGLQKKV